MTDLLLVDTSVYNRARHSAVVEAWAREASLDRVAVTPPAKLEILYSTRSADEYAEVAEELGAFRQVPCGQDAGQRALDVQAALARKGGLQHRSVGFADLLIAAAAELAGATVWHYDSDYDRIAEVTGQPTEWVAPRGSL